MLLLLGIKALAENKKGLVKPLSILIAILAFGLLIFIHELGHYLTARLFDVHILEFSIGMGPKVLSYTSKKTGIAYSWRLLPFGGFVSMAGEDDDGTTARRASTNEHDGLEAANADGDAEIFELSEPVPDPRALCNKPVWQRMIITAAGALMNLLLGLVLSVVFVCTSEALGGSIVAEFNENAISQTQGLMPGDVITHVNGKRVTGYMELVYAILHDGNEPVDLTIRRGVSFVRDKEGVISSWSGGEKIELTGITFGTEEEQGMVLGSMDFKVTRVSKNPINVLKQSFGYLRLAVRQVWDGIIDLITGRVSTDQVSGPVGVTKEIGNAVSNGFTSFIYLVQIITVNLGIVNLLPIPALDGGRFFFQLVELIFRRPIPRQLEGKIHMTGLAILLLFMVIITGKDILKLFQK